MGDILLPQVHLQQEGPPTTVMHIIILHHIPLVVGVTSDGLATASPDEGESVFYVVAVFVEGNIAEVVLRGSEEKL